MVDAWSAEDRLRLVDCISSCSSFSLIGDRFLEPMAEALRASSSVFVEFAERPGQGVDVGRRTYVGARPWSADAYAERYFRDDPLVTPDLRLLHAVNDDPAAYIGALPVAGSWRDSDYYHRFLRRCDISHVLGITVPYRSALGGQLLCLGFHRRHGDAPFGPDEAGLLTRFAPLIASVLSGMAAREVSAMSGLLLDRIAGACAGTGFLVFDEDLMLLHAGGNAMEMLGELRQRLLEASPRPGTAPLRFSLTRPSDGSTLDVGVESCSTDSGTRHVATIRSLTGSRDTAGTWQRLGLTEREAEVARLVCAGYSNTAVGQLLGISLRTVENHLRSIYAKARVSSRTQLAARAQILSGAG